MSRITLFSSNTKQKKKTFENNWIDLFSLEIWLHHLALRNFHLWPYWGCFVHWCIQLQMRDRNAFMKTFSNFYKNSRKIKATWHCHFPFFSTINKSVARSLPTGQSTIWIKLEYPSYATLNIKMAHSSKSLFAYSEQKSCST